MNPMGENAHGIDYQMRNFFKWESAHVIPMENNFLIKDIFPMGIPYVPWAKIIRFKLFKKNTRKNQSNYF